MAKELSEEGAAAIRKALEDACVDLETGIPGVSFFVVNKDGKRIFEHAAGKRGYGSQEPFQLDSVFLFASITKLVTTIAALQLVERGELELENDDQLEKILPELKDKMVLQEDGTMVPKRGRITLLQLLTHTAGFGYSYYVERLKGYGEVSGAMSAIINQPLIHQPGETWEYSISLDWVGILIERVSGMRLEEYFRKHIFDPLGVKNISFFPSQEMKGRMAYINRRSPEGVFFGSPAVPMPNQLKETTEEEKKSIFLNGGGGLFGETREYAQILATLLNNGTSAVTGKQILKPSTVELMFTNQIPQFPNFARRRLDTTDPLLANPLSELYPIPDGGPQGWGLSFMMTHSPTGRSANSGWWAGAPNIFYWVDREKEVAGIIATQIFPCWDKKVMDLWFNVEKSVYDALR